MKKDNKNECFQLVDESGNVIGRISRGDAHNGSKQRHPVVHLHGSNRPKELGISRFSPVFIKSYVFESRVEKELVNVFCTLYNEPIHPSTDELDGGRYWTLDEIKENIGKSVFTPNFENEFDKVLQKGLVFDNLDIK